MKKYSYNIINLNYLLDVIYVLDVTKSRRNNRIHVAKGKIKLHRNYTYYVTTKTSYVIEQLDSVIRPSWQAQISGRKTWTFEPVPECRGICKPSYKVTVEKGEIS